MARIDLLERDPRTPPRGIFEAHRDFSAACIRACHLPRLVQMIETFKGHMTRFRRVTLGGRRPEATGPGRTPEHPGGSEEPGRSSGGAAHPRAHPRSLRGLFRAGGVQGTHFDPAVPPTRFGGGGDPLEDLVPAPIPPSRPSTGPGPLGFSRKEVLSRAQTGFVLRRPLPGGPGRRNGPGRRLSLPSLRMHRPGGSRRRLGHHHADGHQGADGEEVRHHPHAGDEQARRRRRRGPVLPAEEEGGRLHPGGLLSPPSPDPPDRTDPPELQECDPRGHAHQRLRSLRGTQVLQVQERQGSHGGHQEGPEEREDRRHLLHGQLWTTSSSWWPPRRRE